MPLSKSTQRLKNITLPRQDLTQLSFCPSKPAAVAQWAQGLTLTRTAATAAILYKLLPELSRLATSPAERLEMLEAVRIETQQIIGALSKEFLNKPVNLPERSHKAATIAQALQKHMTMGYLVAISALLAEPANKHPEHLLSLALHRALSGLSRLMLRSMQLYVPLSSNYWEQVHTLYQIAEDSGVLLIPIKDPAERSPGATTIRQQYTRILLMGSVASGYLRQSEIQCVYDCLSSWVSLVQLNPVSQREGNPNLFVVNLDGNHEPVYKSHMQGKLGNTYRELDTGRLLEELQEAISLRRQQQPVKNIDAPMLLGENLLSHLVSVWGSEQHRVFDRKDKQGALSVLVGMASLHFYLADKTPLEDLLGAHGMGGLSQTTSFISGTRSGWDAATDAESSSAGIGFDIDFEDRDSRRQQLEQKHPVYTCQMVDSSPSGYCLAWDQSTPEYLRTGELLGLREPGRRNWSLGVVRWIRHASDHTRCGVELISPMASPYGAKVINPGGEDSEYFRVFMLPEIPALKRGKCLLTPSIPFRETSKVCLNINGQEQLIQLTHKVYQTSVLALFEFRGFDTPAKDEGKSAAGDDFSDLYDEL